MEPKTKSSSAVLTVLSLEMDRMQGSKAPSLLAVQSKKLASTFRPVFRYPKFPVNTPTIKINSSKSCVFFFS